MLRLFSVALICGLLLPCSGRAEASQSSLVSSETPAWSPDSRRLAFSAGPAMQHQIYVIDADGNGARCLTSGEQNRWPAWSPDGQFIVFMSDRDGQAELYVMRADGSEQRRLTNTSVHEFAPTWSPKGDVIAYLTEMPDGKQQLMRMHPDGTNATLMDGDQLVYGRPAFRPDGAAVLVGSHRDAASKPGDKWNVRSRIWAVPVAGGEPTPMTRPGFDANPSLAPDGRTLLVDAGDGVTWASNNGQWDLWTVDVETGKRQRLTSTDDNDWGAAWSPDGKSIAFSSGRDRVYVLTIIAADGSKRRTITSKDALPAGN